MSDDHANAANAAFAAATTWKEPSAFLARLGLALADALASADERLTDR